MIKNQIKISMFLFAALLFGTMLADEALAEQVITGTTEEGALYEFRSSHTTVP
jgi:hypothetical protein